MSNSVKPIHVLIVVLLLLIPSVTYVYSLDDEDDRERSFDEVMGDISIETTSMVGQRIYILDVSQEDPEFSRSMELAATLTPLFVQILPGGPNVNPCIIGDGEKGVATITGLTDREVITLTPEQISSERYLDQYTASSTVFLVSSYQQALLLSAWSSLELIPIISTSDPTSFSTMDQLGVENVIAIGDTPVPDDMHYTRIPENEIPHEYLESLENYGTNTDYIVITNPDDIVDYQDRLAEGKLPVAGLSILSAQLAAYRQAPIYFAPGLPTFDETYGDGFTQLGVSRELNNEVAAQIRDAVVHGAADLEVAGMEAKYLALVGGPVTLPMYYWDINDYQQERQYQPCDYYYADLDDDEYQELAVGRIFARSLTDASLLVLRSIIFDEVNQYSYPKDTSSTIYDSVSEDWKENSLACVGTTKIGPFPGILTPTLVNQTATMTEAGYHVTSMGYDLATQAEIVREIIDEMNYAVYYGHGDVDCWYSSVPDPIDADMLNSVDLKPGFAIAMACLTGMTDSIEMDLDQMISLAFLHSGFAGYIGATRVAYGLYDYEIRNDGAICGTGALYLVDVFSELVCSEDVNVGEAMRQAKNDLIYKDGWDDEEVQITVTQYVLYGDPAHNLWVPEHDG